MSTWGIFDFIKTICKRKPKKLLQKVNHMYGVNQLVASYLTIDDLFNLRKLNILLGHDPRFYLEIILINPLLHHKKITKSDEDYLIKKYRFNSSDMKFQSVTSLYHAGMLGWNFD